MSEGPQAVAQKLALLMQAEASGAGTKICTLHPDWLDEQIRDEVPAPSRRRGTLHLILPPFLRDGSTALPPLPF
ncbi:hypothetical protein [Streptomyces sp. NPDC060205]|uniref:hypothetical protein n=1 Tax=Streptomyces sp. NPDC060205 TaxID=3347072 RepID=UPI00366566ED